MKLLGSHAAWNLLVLSGSGVGGVFGVYGYCSVYVFWLSMCLGSFLCRLRVMGAGFPISLVRADLRVSIICWWFRSAKALSLAMRYTLSFGLEVLGCLLLIG